MPGVRLDQLLASTAVVLLLAGAPAGRSPDRTNRINAARRRPTPLTPQPLDSPDLPATAAIDTARHGGADPCSGSSRCAGGNSGTHHDRPARLPHLRPPQRRLRPP